MLAIVIPYFKLTFFEATLQSLANQTDKRFKVYIGDDKSNESPLQLLEQFKGKFDFYYQRFNHNLGGVSLPRQWDRCINLTNSETWIMILGDDDLLGHNVVASWYKNYEVFKDESNLVRFSSTIIFENTKKTSKKFSHPIWETATDSLYRKLKGQTRSSLSEYIFTKNSYLKYGFKNYSLGWCSDSNAWLDFPEEKLIYSINEAIVFIRFSDINISGKIDNIILKNQASIQFLGFIIKHRLFLFKKEQRFAILLAYETTIKKYRKLTLDEWIILMYFYLKNISVISFSKFIRRFLISFFK